MIESWVTPGRIEAHSLLQVKAAFAVLPTTAEPLAEDPARMVEDVFYRGLVPDVVDAPSDNINTRLDAHINRLPLFGEDRQAALGLWGALAEEANRRRRIHNPFLGMKLQGARDFLKTDLGVYLLRPLAFEDRARRNDGYEALYVRDSGLHRRMIEQSATIRLSVPAKFRHDEVVVEKLRQQHLNRFVGHRWESFVVVSILDLVGERCNAFAYRHDERDEIDLILEWRDRSPAERWAIEVAGRRFENHPSSHFAASCNHLDVAESRRFLVFRGEACSGQARGRGGVPALTLPRMFERIRTRMGQSAGSDFSETDLQEVACAVNAVSPYWCPQLGAGC